MMFEVFGQLVAAYFTADLIAAIYHCATDRGWNTKRIVGQFMKHHREPETMTFDLEPLLGGIPIACIGFFALPVFFVSLGLFLGFGQVPHYYTHHPAPRWVQALQRIGLILSPHSHASHHGGKFDRDFSVINGWSNPLLNWAIGKREQSASGE